MNNNLAKQPPPSLAQRWRSSSVFSRTFAVLAIAFVMYLIATPLIALLLTGFTGGATGLQNIGQQISLQNFSAVFATAAWTTIVNSMIYSVGTVLFSLVLTVILAYLIERTDLPMRTLMRTLVVGSLGVPPLVVAIAWVLLGNPQNGLLNAAGNLMNILTLPGMIFVTSTVMVPSMYLMLSGQFTQMDPALEDAAAAAGVGFFQRTRSITLALLRPAILSGGVFFFLITLEAFDVAAVIGLPRNIQVLATAIYVQINASGGVPHYGVAAAYGVILVLISLALVFVYRRALGSSRSRFRVVTGKGYRPRRIRLGRLKIPAVCFVLLIALVETVLPVGILLWSSLLPFFGDLQSNLAAHWTLANFQAVFSIPGILSAAWHTLAIVLVASTAVVILSAWAAWAVDRGRYAGAQIILDGSFLMLGVPGVVIGISILFWYLLLPHFHIPINLYGTIWILAIAYITRFLAYAGRLMDSAMRQVHEDMENAGYASGAGSLRVMQKITIPLLAPAMVRVWLWVAIHIGREVPIAILLVAFTNQTVAAVLWQVWSNASTTGEVSAFSVMLTVVSMLATWGMSRFSGNDDEVVASL